MDFGFRISPKFTLSIRDELNFGKLDIFTISNKFCKKFLYYES
jgi:hypothetical protein